MSAEGHYANRNSLKPPWVSTIELTPAGGGNKGEVVQASYKGARLVVLQLNDVAFH